MIIDLDEKGLALKIIFDGYDFLNKDIAKILLRNKNIPQIISTTYIPEIYNNANLFLDYCKTNKDDCYIPKELMDKYKVGLYNLKDCNDNNNPWKDNNYILFNSKIINPLVKRFPFIADVKFWVCPSFDENGKCDAIGFRVVNSESVLNSFKWIFTCGNNIIYGKDSVNKNEECYIVEGFRDYIALRELGYNVIGLGSVVISKEQESYIQTLSNPILLLDNDDFGLNKTLQYKDKYRIATLIGSKEKDAYDSWIKNGKIDIREIQ